VQRYVYREGVDPAYSHAIRSLVPDDDTARLDCIAEDELDRFDRVVIIGNAGSGKSFLLLSRYMRLASSFMEDAAQPMPLWLDLGSDLGTSMDIERGLRHVAADLWDAAKGASLSGVALFLDALDEVLFHQERHSAFIQDLEYFLADNASCLVKVFLACRRPVWRDQWLGDCGPSFETYSTDHLTHDDYRNLIPDENSLQEFFRVCEERGIRPLLDTPFDGFYLAREFTGGRELPRTRLECLATRVVDMLKAGRSRTRATPHPPINKLRALAQKLACVAMFAGRRSWDQDEVADILGSSCTYPGGDGADADEIRWLLGTPLFFQHGGGFSFNHQLYSEYLAAEALASVPLPKQRQLLEASTTTGHRICTLYRGLGAFLADMSPPFMDYLMENEPSVALFAEICTLSKDDDERLTRQVIDDAIAQHRAPWFSMPPRGERLGAFLHKHRPDDVPGFVMPYLESKSEMSRIWGTHCAHVWGGGTALNPILLDLAHEKEGNTEIRQKAVFAIVASGQTEAIAGLFDLLHDQDHRVRGAVLQTYRETTFPEPNEYIAKLTGGARDESIAWVLQSEVERYASTLDRTELRIAFDAAIEHFDALGNLRPLLLKGLLDHALEIGFDDIPPELLTQVWSVWPQGFRSDGIKSRLQDLLKAGPYLFASVWQRVMVMLEDEDTDFHFFTTARELGSAADDGIFELLPVSAADLNERQERFIQNALTAHFQEDPSRERLSVFQARAPEFTSHWPLPKPHSEPHPEPVHDILAERQHMMELVRMAEGNAVNQAWNVMIGVSEMDDETNRGRAITADAVGRVMGRVGPLVAHYVRKAFIDCVEKVHYFREQVDPDADTLRRQRREFEVPFCYLRRCGHEFSTQKTSDIIRCYGFAYAPDDDRYVELLRELHNRDEVLWERTIGDLLEDPLSQGLRTLVDYLVEVQGYFYVERCKTRLERGWFHSAHFQPLLRYWKAFRQGQYADTLWECYNLLECLRADGSKPRDKDVVPDAERLDQWAHFIPLMMLLEINDDRAWQELARRVAAADVPVQDLHWWSPEQSWPERSDQTSVRVLADWYTLVRMPGEDYWIHARGIAESLLQAIRQVGGDEVAIRELQRLRDEQAFADAEWLSWEIMRIEDEMLSKPRAVWQAAELVDFLAKESLRVVHTEADLFDCACQALEELQSELSRGDGVAGYWDGEIPKSEVRCQNVLWPDLRRIMRQWGVSGIEERLVGARQCDFWVELPRPQRDPLQVAVELKAIRPDYSRRELIDPIQGQLWEKYMRPARCGHGIYVVIWFKDEKRYHYPKQWETPCDLLAELRKECDRASTENSVSITPLILDVSTPPRTY